MLSPVASNSKHSIRATNRGLIEFLAPDLEISAWPSASPLFKNQTAEKAVSGVYRPNYRLVTSRSYPIRRRYDNANPSHWEKLSKNKDQFSEVPERTLPVSERSEPRAVASGVVLS